MGTSKVKRRVAEAASTFEGCPLAARWFMAMTKVVQAIARPIMMMAGTMEACSSWVVSNKTQKLDLTLSCRHQNGMQSVKIFGRNLPWTGNW